VSRLLSARKGAGDERELLQYCLPPNSVVFVGCVGDDKLAEQLAAASRREGLAEAYLVKKDEKTGACAVILTGHHR
jgi:adenosine kinase